MCLMRARNFRKALTAGILRPCLTSCYVHDCFFLSTEALDKYDSGEIRDSVTVSNC